jgi:hypothetical protein
VSRPIGVALQSPASDQEHNPRLPYAVELRTGWRIAAYALHGAHVTLSGGGAIEATIRLAPREAAELAEHLAKAADSARVALSKLTRSGHGSAS